MDVRIGLDYIVENSDYVAKLGAALDTRNLTVKKQVFELLSALCSYSPDGYERTIQTLEHYKGLKGERYRFNVVVVELDRATAVEYQVSILAFINCIIISASNLTERIRIRNEFIGLNLLPVLKNIRRSVASVPELGVQLDVFDEQRECDESQSLQGPDGINLSSHLDVFYAILRQVADTPQEIPFLSILQHLLRIEPKEPISDIIWDTTETLVHRATLIENREDAVKLLRTPSVQKFSTCPHCRVDINSTNSNRKQSLGPATAHSPPAVPTALPPPPPPPCAPPPPPMAGFPPPVPPAPPAPNSKATKNNSSEVTKPKTPEPTSEAATRTLPQQETPVPRTKMKTINWNKIPHNKVVGKNNIWSLVADSHQDSPMADLNWDEMEGLFCQQPTQGSPKLGREGSADTPERKLKRENEISLLDGKRSLNVNIFLKQFRSSNEDIIQLIKNGSHDDIGAEKLRGLLKILPEVDELDVLKSFEGDRTRLGNAEKFLMQLIEVPNYKLRIESMLLRDDFASNLSYLKPSINAMLYAGDDLMTNKALQEVLYMVVVAGNFLNSGGYAGNAAGVKLSSLQKLTDIRANKPGMNLIHFVGLQAEKRNPTLLNFPDEMNALENASKTTLEQLNNEINTLDNRIKKIKKQIDMPTTEKDIKLQMAEFLKGADHEVQLLQDGMRELDVLRVQLAEFFCEDAASFKIEECFKTFYSFCEKFKLAVKENEKRKVQEEQATIRRKQREEQLANKRKQYGTAGTPVSDSENGFLDSQYDVRMSPAMNRRRIGSFNSGGDNALMREDGASPDVTPNGTLRRRRSRVLSEEDEGSLMDFLRSSGHDNSTRERKGLSYGSLDRSWARRARSGSSGKKRPDLLNVDFNADRERPSSPSPLTESKPLPGEDQRPRVSREWRQKIESWLQANEHDDKQNDEYRRKMRRVTANRRSLETDTESERGSKLDPLPEEKPGQGVLSPDSYKRVYPDWKPSSTVEKADVSKTLEAIEDARAEAKDKSVWRKSNLNVSNTVEPLENDPRNYRRQRSRELHKIDEEDRRKNIIQSLGDRAATDKLSIYIRKPSDTPDTSTVKSPKPENKQSIYIKQDNTVTAPAEKHSIYIRDHCESPSIISSIQTSPDDGKQSKVEIDSDNIETPPSTRRLLGASKRVEAPRPLHPQTLEMVTQKNLINPVEQEVLGDGQFDRFSAARRTRRFKRPTDYSSGTDEKSPSTPDTPPQPEPPTSGSKNERLKQWQHKLKTLDMDLEKESNRASTRNITRISQEDVREAIKSLKSPTANESRDVPVKTFSELNDEGFEETQSLVSDASHGKESTSSCNDLTDRRLPERVLSTTTATTSSGKRTPKPSSTLQSLLMKNQQSLEKSRSLRGAAPSKLSTLGQQRRATSMRKTDSAPSTVGRRDVERSSSRASLRSSRSSINSAVSTNTVKKVPLRSQPLSPPKRPLTTSNSTGSTASATTASRTASRAPASRSSSSGSSIGPRKTTALSKVTTTSSFKENNNTPSSSSNAHATGARSLKSTPTRSFTPTTRTSNVANARATSAANGRGGGGGSGGSSFMRPTAASATKVKGK